MEFWIVISKLIIFLYIVFSYVYSSVTNLPWIVFTLLLYFCTNVAIYIFKKDAVKKVFILASIVMIVVSHEQIHPLLLLFLPLNLYEFTSYYIQRRWMILFIMLLPVMFAQENIRMTYSLIAVFDFVVYTMAKLYTERLCKFEVDNDMMRKDMQRLTKNLNENKAYIRQSEYTFKLEERNRLSQEIHDKIGHSMTSALIQMEAAKRLMDTDKEKAAELLQNAISFFLIAIYKFGRNNDARNFI